MENNGERTTELQDLRERVIVLENQLAFAIGVLEKHKQSFEDWSKEMEKFEKNFSETFLAASESELIEAGTTDELRHKIKLMEKKGYSLVDTFSQQDSFFQSFFAVVSKRKELPWMKKP